MDAKFQFVDQISAKFRLQTRWKWEFESFERRHSFEMSEAFYCWGTKESQWKHWRMDQNASGKTRTWFPKWKIYRAIRTRSDFSYMSYSAYQRYSAIRKVIIHSLLSHHPYLLLLSETHSSGKLFSWEEAQLPSPTAHPYWMPIIHTLQFTRKLPLSVFLKASITI